MTIGPPYTAGDEMTCTSSGNPPVTYAWTIDGSAGSSTSSQTLVEGEHEYVCTATVDLGGGKMCSNIATLTVTAFSKYRKP